MAEWNGQMANGEYSIQFSTKDKDEYKFIEKACQSVMDGTYTEFKPVTHGIWNAVGNGNWFCDCSRCGERWLKANIEMRNMNYCPNCGAKMNLEA